MKILHSKY